ncbi:hypothetical protein ACOXXE_24100 [Pseudomonas mediterranea]|uniref:hypothetical protein n=1 Tax=Pseudomonas mediterranea TaxID=183795 RepID=UPI003BF5CB5E
MEEQQFHYDVHLYDRRFLNCFQRHAVVFMKRLGIEVDWLFYNALPAVDDIFQQMVVENKAKYALQSPYFADDDLALLGVRFHERKAERLDDLLPVIHQQIQAYGCAFLSGDVYYFAHCPEYRSSHAQHVVVLRQANADGSWDIVDDNPASVLCEYRYPQEVLDQFFQNEGSRRMFCLEWTPTQQHDIDASFRQRHQAFLDNFQAQPWFYAHLEQLLDNPLAGNTTKFRALHDVFTLLAGSRHCFARYLSMTGVPEATIERVERFAKEAGVLKGLMVMAQITGKVRRRDLIDRCAALEGLEAEYLGDLRSQHQRRMAQA